MWPSVSPRVWGDCTVWDTGLPELAVERRRPCSASTAQEGSEFTERLLCAERALEANVCHHVGSTAHLHGNLYRLPSISSPEKAVSTLTAGRHVSYATPGGGLGPEEKLGARWWDRLRGQAAHCSTEGTMEGPLGRSAGGLQQVLGSSHLQLPP